MSATKLHTHTKQQARFIIIIIIIIVVVVLVVVSEKRNIFLMVPKIKCQIVRPKYRR